MAAIKDIVVDCGRPAAVADFWAHLLDGYAVAPYDEAELERLRGMGIDDVADDPTVLVEPASGVGPRFFFQRVLEDKAVKNRVHLDLVSTDTVAELTRVVELGGRVVAEHAGHVVLADLEGNEFCLLR